MMMREDCEKGFFVSFDYSSDALQEIESFFKRSHKVIVALTVQEILDELIALKLDSWAGSPIRRQKERKPMSLNLSPAENFPATLP